MTSVAKAVALGAMASAMQVAINGRLLGKAGPDPSTDATLAAGVVGLPAVRRRPRAR